MSTPSLSITSKAKLLSGYDIPRLGFGVALNKNTTATVLEAIGAGYRHIDCAQHYGNEAECGAALRQSDVPRGEMFYTTKVFNTKHGYESTLAAVDESLAAAGFDYIDLFLIHDPRSGKDGRIATYRALLAKRDEGKIRSVGVSNFSVRHIEELLDAGLELPSVNQIEIHPWCQQKPIVDWCAARGIVVQAFCPLARSRAELMSEPTLVRLAEKHARAPAQILLRWSLQRGFVPLPKSETPARIRANAALFDFALDEEDMRALDALDKGREGAVSWNPVDAP